MEHTVELLKKEMKIEVAYGPAIPGSGIYQKKKKNELRCCEAILSLHVPCSTIDSSQARETA